MRTIRISINPPKIPENADYEHESTSWQVSKTPEFKDEDILVESLKDEDNKIEYRFSVNLEYYKTVYTRAKIHLSDGRSGEWTRPTTITRNQEGFKYSNNIVLTPIAELDISVTRDKTIVDIRSNKFYMFAGVGKHIATDWIIEDSDGNVIYQRLNDKINLTRLKTDEIKLEENKLYVVKVSYKTDTLAVSNYGKTTFNTNKVLKNCLDFKNRYFLRNDSVVIPFSNNIENIVSIDYILEDLDGTPKVINQNYPFINNGIKIDFSNLDTKEFVLRYRARLTDGAITEYNTFKITTLISGGLTERDDREYAETLTEISSFEDILVEASDTHTLELKNGMIPFYPKGEITPINLTFDYKNKKLKRDGYINDLTLNADINTVEQVTAITETNTNKIVVSYYIKNTEETFIDVFEFLPTENKFRFLKTFKIDNAKKGSRGMNQLLPLDDQAVVFTVWDNEDNTNAAKFIYLLDTNLLEIYMLEAHGNREKQIGLMTYDGKIVVYGGVYKNEDGEYVQDEVCYSYDFKTKEWREVTYLNTDGKTFEISALRLKNGNYVMYANYYKESTEHTDKRWWEFQNDSERIDVIDDLELPSYVYDNLNDNDRRLLNFSIVLSNGNTLINYVEKEPNTNKLRSFMFS